MFVTPFQIHDHNGGAIHEAETIEFQVAMRDS